MKWRVEEPSANLARFLGGKLSRSGKSVRKLLEARRCLVNGKIERFGSVAVRQGDEIEMASDECEKKKWEVKVLYEDESLKVVEKQVGWVCSEENAKKFYGAYLVHRLDKETTGVLLLAKSLEVQQELMGLFARGKIAKEYLALVDGRVEEEEGIRESLLARRGRMKWGSMHRGLRAITKWKVVKREKDTTLVQCEPLTGRTHQIRVHMAEMGHPILGDRQYAAEFQCKRFVNRYLLHASRIVFSYRGKTIDVECAFSL